MPYPMAAVRGGKTFLPTGENPWYDPGGEGLCVSAAYDPKMADSYVGSLLDITGNGNHAWDWEIEGPEYVPDWAYQVGWDFDGIDNMLETPFYPGNGGTQAQSVLIWFSDLATTGDYLFGCASGNGEFAAHPIPVPRQVRYVNGDGRIDHDVGFVVTSGVLGIAGNQAYRDGINEGITLPTWYGHNATNIYIGALNLYNFQPFYNAEFKCHRYAVYDCVLSDSQMATVTNGMKGIGI